MAIEDEPPSDGSDRSDGSPRPPTGGTPDLSGIFVRIAVILGHARHVAVGPDRVFMLSPALWTTPGHPPLDSQADGGDAWVL